MMILGGCGLFYPVVGRNVVWYDVPKSLLVWSGILGIAYSIWCIYRTKSSFENVDIGSLIFSCMGYFTLGILSMLGTLLLINGVFDQSNVQIHNARVVGQYISRGRHTSYFWKLEDWKNGSGIVTIEVSSSVYENFNNQNRQPAGRTAQVETANGFLGYERFIKIR